jgi:S1-C subfamily serine protease
MFGRSVALALGVLLVLSTAALAQDAPPPAKEWTILVYVCGDNDLAPFALLDVNEMELVGSTDAVDVVVQFDGEQVRSASQFTRLVRETPVGRTVKMSVMRGGARVEVTATTEAQAAQFSWSGEGPGAERLKADAERLRSEIERSVRERQRSLPEGNYQFRVQPRVAPGPLADRFMWYGEGGPMGMLMSRGRLGVTIQDLTPELAEYFGVKDGVLVSSVEKDSAAAKAGIKAGDVITSVDGTAIADGSGLVEQLRSKEGDVSIGLSRDKKAMTLKATLEKPQAPRGRIVARWGPA